MAELCRPERAAGDAALEKPGIPGGKDSNPGKPAPPGGCRLPVSPGCPTRAGLKLELNAEANPGSTGEEEGTPAAAAAATAAWRGATVATEEEAPGMPIKDDSTGLPAAGDPEPPNPGKAGFGPGGRPGNTDGAVVNPSPKGV